MPNNARHLLVSYTRCDDLCFLAADRAAKYRRLFITIESACQQYSLKRYSNLEYSGIYIKGFQDISLPAKKSFWVVCGIEKVFCEEGALAGLLKQYAH
jgi:hypothetical protein